jgi:hypothetical protein
MLWAALKALFCLMTGSNRVQVRPPNRPKVEELEDRSTPGIIGVWTGGGATDSWLDPGNWRNGKVPTTDKDSAVFGAIAPGMKDPRLLYPTNLTLSSVVIRSDFAGHTLKLIGSITVKKDFFMHAGTITQPVENGPGSLTIGTGAYGDWDGGTISYVNVTIHSQVAADPFVIGAAGSNSVPTISGTTMLIAPKSFVTWQDGDVVLANDGSIANQGTFQVNAAHSLHMWAEPNAEGSVADDVFLNRGLFNVLPQAGSGHFVTIDPSFELRQQPPKELLPPQFWVQANVNLTLTGGGWFGAYAVDIDQAGVLTLNNGPVPTSTYQLNATQFSRSVEATKAGTLNLGGIFTATGLVQFGGTGLQVTFGYGLIKNSKQLQFGSGTTFNWVSGTIQGGLTTIGTGAQAVLGEPSPSVVQGFLLPEGTLGLPNLALDGGVFQTTDVGSKFGGDVTLNAEVLQLSNGAFFRNFGPMTINDGVQIYGPSPTDADTSSLFNSNSGVIEKMGSGLSLIDIRFPNEGTIQVMAGTLKAPWIDDKTNGAKILDAVGNQTKLNVDGYLDLEGGSLGNIGIGASEIVGDVVNTGGTVYPGGPGFPGIVNIDGTHGDYTQGEGGALAIEIGGTTPGTGYSQLNLIGTTGQPAPLDGGEADLAGTLALNLVNGFTPSVGDTFTVLTYTSYTGDFQTVTGDRFGSSDQYYFIVTYNPTNVTLTVANWTGGSAPSISSLSTSSGTTAGGTSVTLTGSNFTNAYDVSFGGVPAESFTVNSDSSITAIAPPQDAGSVNVSVTTPLGTGSYSGFTYTNAPAPTVTGLSNTSGSAAGGNTIAILGSNFTAATGVSFGSTALDPNAFTVVSDNSIIATVPAGTPGTVDVQVTTDSGTSTTSSADQYTDTAVPAPVVSALSPSSGGSGGGTLVYVSGSGLTGATAVLFGGVPATNFTVNSDSLITALAPPLPAGTWDVTVTTPGGTSATVAADQFTVTADPAPAVTSIAPSSGSSAGGAVVTVNGSGFTGFSAVDFGGVPSTSVTFVSDSELLAVAPAQAAGTVDVTVTTPSGTSPTSSTDQFTYTAAPAPSVTGVSPAGGGSSGGSEISITGSGFTGASDVTFGPVPADDFQVVSDGLIFATAPSQAAGTVDVTVTTPSGTSSTGSADQFTYTASPAPAVTGLTPATGSTDGGSTIVLLGSGFTGASAVNFGTTAATAFTVLSDDAIEATAPALAAGTVDVTVVTPSGTSSTSSADQFTATAPALPTVTGLSASSGSTAGGTVVTITGTGFSDAIDVTFGGIDATSFAVNSATQITAVAPPDAAGTWDVQVINPAGTSNPDSADRFTYTLASTPAVTGVSPSSGSTAGGTTVTVTGSGFTGATAVTFGSVAATSFTVNSDSSITATAPPQAAGIVDITVTTSAGTSATRRPALFPDSNASLHGVLPARRRAGVPWKRPPPGPPRRTERTRPELSCRWRCNSCPRNWITGLNACPS